jgi:sugar lactone lactonase YvrE
MSRNYVSSILTEPNGFTRGIEGPACDKDGVLYAVNYEHQGTIGSVSPKGVCDVFLELPSDSIGNGIRFHSGGDMFIADYTGHNILQVNMDTKAISVFAHEPRMNQPNDIAIAKNNTIYASDPDWSNGTGQIWKIDNQGNSECLETGMGTTNGIEVSPDEKTLYVNESLQKNVWAYDILPDGSVNNKRLMIQFPDFNMDGMRCDIDGNIYITRHGKGTIAKLSPTGEVLLEIELTGQDPSNLAFGGSDGCTIYVTIQDRGNVESFQVEQPGRSWALHSNNI